LDTRLAYLGAAAGLPKQSPGPLRVIGIDLGTTNSTVAEIVWSADEPLSANIRCLEIEQETSSGSYTHIFVPSSVALWNGRVWIGEGAKRLLGRSSELQLELGKNLFAECKNEIGSRRTYHRAPEDFRSPTEIATHVLRFVSSAAQQESPVPVSRTVVTVPASFQAAQRNETMRAARAAGLSVQPGDLLDEPIAALLAYLWMRPSELGDSWTDEKSILVFDFGGGTCDVAVLRIGRSPSTELPRVSPLSVSRYHRLGGGDIDRAIVHEVLIPQLLKQNDLDPSSLSYEDRKLRLEPALLGAAEALKIGLCTEISRLCSFEKYEGADKQRVEKIQPGLHTCPLQDRKLTLNSPRLSAEEFERLLEPFLSTNLLFTKETEYRLTCSIFAPIEDAIERAGLRANEIDLVLLVGGSSLIPQIPKAMRRFFSRGRVLEFPDRESTQAAVARGAAIQSLALALRGQGVFSLATHDEISVRTNQGPIQLVPRGATLPYPADGGWASTNQLVVPTTSILEPLELRVEIRGGTGDQERHLFSSTWTLEPPVNGGARLLLEYRLDENQVLSLRMRLAEGSAESFFETQVENPLTNVVNPNTALLEIQEAEERLRSGEVPKDAQVDLIVEIARNYEKIGQVEKAISYLKQALRRRNSPDVGILNLLGTYCGRIKDFSSEEQYLRAAIRAGDEDVAPFNLALALQRRGDMRAAREHLLPYASRSDCGPTCVLAAQLAESLGMSQEREEFLEKARARFGDQRFMDEWELHWHWRYSVMTGDLVNAEKALVESRRRKLSKSDSNEHDDSSLPDMARDLRRI
jgi:molecular chaperone DnaK (HSP70)/tetratricopeptide (TPR) repeat protein